MAIVVPFVLAALEVETAYIALAGVAMAVTGVSAKIDQAASKVFGEDLVKVASIAGLAYGAFNGGFSIDGVGTEAALAERAASAAESAGSSISNAVANVADPVANVVTPDMLAQGNLAVDSTVAQAIPVPASPSMTPVNLAEMAKTPAAYNAAVDSQAANVIAPTPAYNAAADSQAASSAMPEGEKWAGQDTIQPQAAAPQQVQAQAAAPQQAAYNAASDSQAASAVMPNGGKWASQTTPSSPSFFTKMLDMANKPGAMNLIGGALQGMSTAYSGAQQRAFQEQQLAYQKQRDQVQINTQNYGLGGYYSTRKG